MKKLIDILLVASIGLSLLLLAVLLAGYESPADEAPAPVLATQPARPVKPAIDTETWKNLRSDDLTTMVQRLRERGFPPEFIRAIIAAQLRELYTDRMKDADPDADQRPFWKNYSIDPKVRVAQYRLYREQQDILRTLLGAEADPRENMSALFRGLRFDTVPPEKLADVQGILRNFEAARSDLYAGAGMIGPEIQKRVEALQKEQHAALAQVLTPQELEEWDVRNSDTARSLRYQLSAFDASEAEFRTLFKLQSEFEERFPRMTVIPSPEEQQRRSEAQRQLNEQIKAALGTTRGDEYARATDFSYRQTSQLVARLELPPATTTQIHEVQKEIREKMNAVMRSNPAPAERAEKFAQLAAEAETRVTSILGSRGFEAYKQYGGTWMQSMRPRPPSNAAVRSPAR
jgi:hypothetical protein